MQNGEPVFTIWFRRAPLRSGSPFHYFFKKGGIDLYLNAGRIYVNVGIFLVNALRCLRLNG